MRDSVQPENGYVRIVKRLMRVLWRLATIAVAIVIGGTPRWLEDKMERDEDPLASPYRRRAILRT